MTDGTLIYRGPTVESCMTPIYEIMYDLDISKTVTY